jgi:hypothetical protein
MRRVDMGFFRANGYFVLNEVFTGAELSRFQRLYDEDRGDRWYFWRLIGPGGHQTVNCDPLVSSPDIDDFVRHPGLVAPITEIMGGPICVSEVCFRHMAPYQGAIVQQWHRDRQHDLTHPLRTAYVHCMIYLTDVDEHTHCFSISPESIDDPILERDEQLSRRGILDIHGPAGTVALFNLSVLHTATVRPTTHERKTLQTYYGHRSGPTLSPYSTFPPRLWRDHPNEEVRAMYGNLNEKSRLFADVF